MLFFKLAWERLPYFPQSLLQDYPAAYSSFRDMGLGEFVQPGWPPRSPLCSRNINSRQSGVGLRQFQ